MNERNKYWIIWTNQTLVGFLSPIHFTKVTNEITCRYYTLLIDISNFDVHVNAWFVQVL